MAKSKQSYVCQQCGAQYTKWMGRCENCGEWNTLVEQLPQTMGKSAVDKSAGSGSVLVAQTLRSIDPEERIGRMPTGIGDLDIVLGGGILPGGVTLLAGQPGMGKSTRMLQQAIPFSMQVVKNLRIR